MSDERASKSACEKHGTAPKMLVRLTMPSKYCSLSRIGDPPVLVVLPVAPVTQPAWFAGGHAVRMHPSAGTFGAGVVSVFQTGLFVVAHTVVNAPTNVWSWQSEPSALRNGMPLWPSTFSSGYASCERPSVFTASGAHRYMFAVVSLPPPLKLISRSTSPVLSTVHGVVLMSNTHGVWQLPPAGTVSHVKLAEPVAGAVQPIAFWRNHTPWNDVPVFFPRSKPTNSDVSPAWLPPASVPSAAYEFRISSLGVGLLICVHPQTPLTPGISAWMSWMSLF